MVKGRGYGEGERGMVKGSSGGYGEGERVW